MRGVVGVIGSCVALSLTSIGIGACGGSASEVVARVGDLPITSAALDHWTSMSSVIGSPAARSLGASSASGLTARQRTLLFLVACARTLAEAREKGIVVSDREADAAIKLLHDEKVAGVSPEPHSRQSAIASLVAGGAETPSDRRWIAKVYLLSERLRQREQAEAEAAITPSQLAGYYSRNQRDFHLPERRQVAVVLTWHKSDIELAKRELQSGRPWSDVLSRRDDEPAVGGIKVLAFQTLPHAFEREFFSAKPHVLVGPHKYELYYLYEVLAVKAPRQRALAEVQATIRRRLVTGAGEPRVAEIARALEQRWKARTRCRPGFVVAQCGGPL